MSSLGDLSKGELIVAEDGSIPAEQLQRFGLQAGTHLRVVKRATVNIPNWRVPFPISRIWHGKTSRRPAHSLADTRLRDTAKQLVAREPRARSVGLAELVTGSPAQYWEMISEHVSLAVAALQQVDEQARERIRASAIAKVSAFEKDGKVRVPGLARCIVRTK